jgi:hypothetical protein
VLYLSKQFKLRKMKEETKPQVGWIATEKDRGITVEITEAGYNTFNGLIIRHGKSNWSEGHVKNDLYYHRFTFAPPSPEPIMAEFSDNEVDWYERELIHDLGSDYKGRFITKYPALDKGWTYYKFMRPLNHAKKDIQKQIDEKKREIEELTKKMEEL